jgi:hypothetical protein
MAEPMGVRVEVWPLVATSTGVWLVSGDDAWRPSVPVMSDTEPHGEVEMALATNEALDDAVLLHSTSWRTDGQAVVLTYVAVLRCSELVQERWPQARPVSIRLAEAVGKPPTNAPVDAPAPRYIDVLLHGIRHLKFLLETDATNAAALDDNWRTHLSALSPALAGMYDETHQPA